MSKFEDALRFAIDVHAGMYRKADVKPYIVHPIEVAAIAAGLTDDEDVLCAAALHDVVEDTPHTIDEIRERFGSRVATYVAGETEDKREDLPAADTWLIRKQETLAHLEGADDEAVRILWLADKLSNIRSFERVHREQGDAMWSMFNQTDPSLHAWYYREIARATESLADSHEWQEYVRLIDEVFGEEA